MTTGEETIRDAAVHAGTDAGGTVRVLHVDADEGILETVGDHLERELEDVVVLSGSDGDDALDVAGGVSLSCLVLGDGLSEEIRRSLVEAADCPAILYTERDATAVPSSLRDAVATVVEKGGTDQHVSVLARKVDSLTGERPDKVEDALSRALTTVEETAERAKDLFLVDDDGGVVWASGDFESVFPVAESDTDLPDTDDFYERLGALVPDLHDAGGRLLDVDAAAEGAGDQSGDQSVVVPTAEGTYYYLRSQYRLPAAAGGFRVELFEDVTDRVRREARTSLLELLVEQAQDGLYTLDENGVIDFCNESFAEKLGYEREEIIGEHASVTLVEGELEKGQETVGYLMDNPDEQSTEVDMHFVTKAGEELEVSIHFTLLRATDGSYAGLMGVVRDVSERKRRKRELEAQRDELSTLNRTNVLIQDIIRTLGGAATRDQLERIVCDRLVDSDRYQLAWIGEREGGNDRLAPRTVAGPASPYIESETVRLDEETDGPGARALRTGEVQVIEDIREEPSLEAWRERAAEWDLRSMVVVPLNHGETTHGILAVYVNRTDVFSDRIVESFAVLGETIGFALTAVQNKRLLQRDVCMRLEFRSTDDDGCLTGLARACDCTVEAAGAVDVGDDVVQYLQVEGADSSTVVETLLESDDVSNARVVRESDQDGAVVEARTDTSLHTLLASAGARPREAVATPDGLRVVAEASMDADVRAIQEVIQTYNAGATLVSKTEHDEPMGESEESALTTEPLTDRQEEILRTAYLAGYYAWPRDTNAEQLADTLGLASPTLHQHLRRGERNLLAKLFEE